MFEKVIPVYLSIRKYPEACWHIIWAIAQGHPIVLHYCPDKRQNRSRRKSSLKKIPRKVGYDRDEYPPSCSFEGGKADVKYLHPSDNRGSGSIIGSQLRGLPDGTAFKIIIVL